MITVHRKKAQYMPCLNSCFLTNYDQEVVDEIKALREEHLGGDKYLGQGVWEVTDEVWERLCHFPHTVKDDRVSSPCPFILTIDENDSRGKYYYQELTSQELHKRFNCLLFFDTGTGKTRTALLALSALSKEMEAVIIVGESNLSMGWMTQVERHFPEMQDRFKILNDGRSIPDRIKMVKASEEGTIFIVNIESMRSSAFVDALNSRNLAVAVLDECQCIIGSNALQTAGMQALKTDFRWALSATPIKNSPIEWFSLLAWLRVIKFEGMKTRFNEYYAYATRNRFGQWEYTTFRHEEDLEDLKNSVTIRVEKKGLNLPRRHIKKVPLDIDSELESILKKISREKSKEWIDTTIKVADQEIKAENVPTLFYIERVATSISKEKIDFVLKQTQEPMIVVSSLRFPLEYIHSLIPDESVLYHGQISHIERARNLHDFISGKKRVLLMTRKSGGTGLDGLQNRARIMIFLDAPENRANFEQCADRLHRVGQDKEVFIYIPKVEKSLDIYSWEHLDEKYSWIDRYYKVQYET